MLISRFSPLFSCLVSITVLGQQPRLIVPVGHTGGVLSACFSPDGKYILTASADKTAKLWDVNSGLLLTAFSGKASQVKAAVFSPDAKSIITITRDGEADTWDIISGKSICKIYSSGINSGMYSPDGKKILIAEKDGGAAILHAGSCTHQFIFLGHTKEVLSAVYSRDGKMMVTASKDSTAMIWNTSNDDAPVATLRGHHNVVNFATFSPDGQKIITVSEDSTVKVWDAATAMLLYTLKGHQGKINSAAFSPGGEKIITTSNDETAKVWDVNTGKMLVELLGHNRSVIAAMFSPDEKKIVTGSYDKNAIIWNALTGKQEQLLEGHSLMIMSVTFSPDGQKILTSSLDNTARIWDCRSGKQTTLLKGEAKDISSSLFSACQAQVIMRSRKQNYTGVLDVLAGKVLTSLKTNAISFNDLVISPDCKMAVTIAGNAAKIWNPVSGELLFDLIGHKDVVRSVVFSPDSKWILTALADSVIRIWDVHTGQIVGTLKDSSLMSFANFSPGSNQVATTNLDGMGSIWNIYNKEGKTQVVKKVRADYIFFSPDGTKYATIIRNIAMSIWDINSGSELLRIKDNGNTFPLIFSPDGSRVLAKGEGNEVEVWDIALKQLVTLLLGHTGRVTTAVFSTDGTKIVTASADNEAKIWNANNYSLLADLKGHTNSIETASFSFDGAKVLTASFDNSIKIWDAATINRDSVAITRGMSTRKFKKYGKGLLYTFIAFNAVDFFTQINEGYYQATPAASKLLHYVTKDLKVITFEQLDVKYNRPDKVLEAIGNTDTALINSYRKAWEKRIKKLGIDTTAFRDGYSVPEADFAKRDTIEYEQKNGALKLHIMGMDSTYKLDRFNIWVNEAPLFGQRGINIKRKNSNSLDTTITIKLSQGENRIETSISNVNGTESYRMPLHVNYTPAVKQKETTRFIGIGIDQFSQSQYNLQYSTKDIRDLSIKLKEKYGNDIIIDTLFNENVTVSNVKALKQKLQQTTENDKVIITYSGHGMLSKEYDYYLSTYSVNFDKPEEGGLPYDELENLLDSIPARKKLMLIDACHSGEVDKDEQLAMDKRADSLGLKRRGVIVTNDQQQRVGLNNSFELMQSLFVNVGKSTGATIISAAAGNQYALEGVNNLPNGIFTYSIIEAMNKYPNMKISELKKIVGERVEQLTNGLQKPTSRNEAIAVDWNIWETRK